MAEHTPVWSVAEKRHEYDQLIRDAKGGPVCAVYLAGWPVKEATSHVRLIAAAPELLTALEWIMDDPKIQTGIGGNPNYVEAGIARIRDVIAAARGKS